MPNAPIPLNIGDIVKIRDWDDMKEKYGGSNISIPVTYNVGFTIGMKMFCNGIYKIAKVQDSYPCKNYEYKLCSLDDKELDKELGRYYFTAEMFEWFTPGELYNPEPPVSPPISFETLMKGVL